MTRISKTTLTDKTASLLRGNEGTSLVLVSIIAIIIITGVIILRVTTSALWASADKQYNQDQAYMLATSLGESLDEAILDSNSGINLAEIGTVNDTAPGMAKGTVTIQVTSSGSNYNLEVRAEVANATYVYTAVYSGSPGSYTRQR
ncbi:MAG: hypothetical protein IJ757_05790 [Clostridiales bacterium]|nr:hypothetical protein [Clostridiales bacterium]